MEDLEETDLAEVDKEKKMEEEKEMKEDYGKKDMEEEKDMDEGYGKNYEAKDMDEAEDMDEELNLEEILAELELEEEKDMDETKDMDEMKDMDEEKDMDEAMDMEMDDDAEINLEDMSEDELKTMIEDVIEDMIEDGELVPGPNADESEEEEMEDTDDGMEGDADVDIEVDDIDLQEGKEDMDEAMMGMNALVRAFKMLGDSAKRAFIKAIEFEIPGIAPGMGFYREGKEELEETIKTLRSDLNEVNLLNSKLLYTNKIFKGKNLTENQKIKVLKAFDKAETVKEAKRIFETLNENLVAKTKKSNIRESMGAASKPAGVAPKSTPNKVIQEDAMVSRFKQLAGIK
jgi:hypothetical protein